MFGEAVFGLSNHKKPMLLHKTANSVYEFCLKHSYTSKTTNETTHSYTCVGCDQKKKKNTELYRQFKVQLIHVKNKQLLDDPTLIDHICVPKTAGENLAKQIDRESRVTLQQGLKRPRDAYKEAEAKLIRSTSDFGDRGSEIQLDAEAQFPDYNRCRRSFCRNASKACPKVLNWLEIPDIFRTTYR